VCTSSSNLLHILKCKCNIFIYIYLCFPCTHFPLFFLSIPESIITGFSSLNFALQLILSVELCRIQMKEKYMYNKRWKNAALACAHNFPECRTCRKWQLLAFDCFTDDVNDVSTRSHTPKLQFTQSPLRSRVLAKKITQKCYKHINFRRPCRTKTSSLDSQHLLLHILSARLHNKN